MDRATHELHPEARARQISTDRMLAEQLQVTTGQGEQALSFVYTNGGRF